MNQTVPLLLVPGLASSARVYGPVIPALWRLGTVMVANDIRDDSIPAIARRILDEAPQRFALAGHSMGGYIAFEIMRQAPERVARLALINTQARADTPEAIERRRGHIARARRGELSALRDEMFPDLVHSSRRDDESLRKLMHAQDEDVGVERYVAQQNAMIARVDSRPTMAGITCPTLVLSGDEDKLIPNWLSKEMAEGIAGARLVILDRCGHLPQPEQPEATVAALAEWLRS